MRLEDITLREPLRLAMLEYAHQIHPLPGIASPAAMDAFLFQVVESVRRIRFIREIAKRHISSDRADATSELFDPIRAAMLHKEWGDLEEACWLVFLFTHFGRNRKSGYRLLRDVYGRFGDGETWNWVATRADPMGFRYWLDSNLDALRSGSVHRAFGNHRKYQSLDPWKAAGTGAAVQSYISWVSSVGSHAGLFDTAAASTLDNPEHSFALLYTSMRQVISFGRTARFDYLSMLGKLDLANIRPNSVHFGSATGPVKGANLLFFDNTTGDYSNPALEDATNSLATYLGLDKQVMEDSLCNWQKSPTQRRPFRG